MSGRVKSFLEKITSQSTVLISIKLVRQINPTEKTEKKTIVQVFCLNIYSH